ncbi:hypothetical protein [Acrocarpospora sp. B8E8]|uniref:hypothetical protein n=1 Tax=Acrocarpospora sp. B8E8 TaxID=3153572 RepID=UPI00325D2563
MNRILALLAVPALLLATTLTGTAHAAPQPPDDLSVLTEEQIQALAVEFATCDPSGSPSSADAANATDLNAVMSGRLAGYMTAYRVSCARMIVQTVQGRGLAQRAAVIAITTAIVESGLQNYATPVDHDSLGLFQQRPSQGWGTPAQLIDPVYATNAFINAMLRKFPNNSWMSGDIGAICQAVQVSDYPSRYQPEVPDAQRVVDALWNGAGGGTTLRRVGIVKFDGTVLVKEGALNAGWKDMLPGGVMRRVVLSGDRVGVLKSDGTVLVKDGQLNAGWKDMLPGGSMKDLALSGDRVGIVKADGTALVKEGELNAGWKDMLPGGVIKQIALSGDRVGIIKADGTALVKDGELNAGWKDMLPGGDIKQIALSGDRVGIIKADGTALVKDGELNAGWKDMLPGGVIKQIVLDGTRIGIIKSDGTVLVKDGELNAGWKDMLPGGVMKQIALSGNRVGMVKSDGTVLVKEGELNAGWKDMLPGGVMTEVALG